MALIDEALKRGQLTQASASLASRGNQIPTGGPKAPAPDGRSDTELGRNVNNALSAMGGMGVVSSVPLRQPPASTALATVAPAAGFAPGALAKMGQLATAAAPQAAQAMRALPGTNAALQQGAQANAYAAAGRTLGGASAGATALDNNRPADPMAPPPPKVNSFGDAAPASRALSAMQTLPSAASAGAARQVTTPEARKAVGLFPYSHPDAGANIYAGVGLSKGGEQQAVGAALQATTPDPMAAHNQKLAAAQELQGWRQAPRTSDSPTARQNYLTLQQKAVDMQPSYFAQQGPLAAQARVDAESAASRALQSMYTQKPPAIASAPASNPYANVTPEQGRAMAEINAKVQSPTSAPQPQSLAAMAMQATGDVKREGNSYSGTNVAGDITINGQALRNGGPISAQNMAAANALAGRQQPESMGRLTAAQQLTAPNMNVSAPTVQHSGNSWQARIDLRNAQVSASSIMNNGGRWDQHGRAGSPEGAAYKAMLGTDQALRQAQPGMDQEAMRQNAGLQREGMQQAGSTARALMQEAGQNSRFGQTHGTALSKLAMEQEAQGFSSRAAAQQEQLRNVLLNPNATPEQRKVAQRSLAALSGKTAADRMQTVALPDTVDNGQVVRGGQALVRTLEDGTVEQVPIGAQGQGGAQPSANRITFLRANPKQADFFDQWYGKGAAARILGGG